MTFEASEQRLTPIRFCYKLVYSDQHDYSTLVMGYAMIKRWSIRKAKHKLEAVLFRVWVPVRPIPIPRIIGFVLNLPSRDPERDGLVWLSGNLPYAR